MAVFIYIQEHSLFLLLSDSFARRIDLLLHFFDNLPDAPVVCINHNIPPAGRKVQPVEIRFALIAAPVMPLLQRLLRTGEREGDGFIILARFRPSAIRNASRRVSDPYCSSRSVLA